MKKTRRRAVCPFCGSEIDADAAACTECGSDGQTGWSEKTYMDGIDLPDDDEYDELVANEFGGQEKRPPTGRRLFFTVVAIITAVAFVFLILKQLL